MLPTPLIPALFTAICVLLLVASIRREWRAVQWVAKPLASLGFLGVALAAGAGASSYGRLVLGALVLCLAGDVLLLPRSRKSFMVGLFSFLLGHVAFGVAFLHLGVEPVAVGVALGVEGIAGWIVLRFLWFHVPGSFRAPVVAYVLIISGMLALAVGAGWRVGAPWLPLAAFAFYVSDLAVARHRFVREAFVNRLVGLPLYYGAQVVLAWSAGLLV